MFEAAQSPYLVPFDGTFKLADSPAAPPADAPDKKGCKKRLSEAVDRLDKLQRKLYATDTWSVLSIFQALDAGGKDGTIRAVFKGVNPAGCQVFSFKQPSKEELDHDFLWRSARRLPERGRIGVFNRSYYEEVLVVRVHPQYLEYQKLPNGPHGDPEFWNRRFRAIVDHERHLAESGTVVCKFFLNVSKEEQRQRFLARIDNEDKNWKFSSGDVAERGHWDDYQTAFQEALAATSRPWAPWYAIPADDKPFMRMTVAEILVRSLESLGLHYPDLGTKEMSELETMRRILEEEG